MGFVYSVHRPAWKDNEVEALISDIKHHKILAIVSIQGIPARQFQKIRAELRGVATLRVARNTLIDRALQRISDEMAQLFKHVEGQTALVFTDQNPFKLYAMLEKSKTPAPAKAGDIAPRDVIVEKGPTSFRPGPIVGDFQNAGIPAAIEKGKVIIRETKVIVKEGDQISAKIAHVLQRLQIDPMEVGLYVRAAYDGSTIYTPQDLLIDVDAYYAEFLTAASQAFNLALNIAYPTGLTIVPLLEKGTVEARNLAINGEIFEPDIMEVLLTRAETSAHVLVALLPDAALDDELLALKRSVTAVTAAHVEEAPATEAVVSTHEEEEKKEESGFAGLESLFG